MVLPVISAANVDMIETFELGVQDNLQNGWKHSRPAWRVEAGDETFVLKAEFNAKGANMARLARDSARWGGKLMGKVSPLAKPVMLTNGELTALQLFPPNKFRGPKHCDYVRDLIQSGMFVFYKMNYVADLRNVDSMLKQGKGDKLIAKLKDEATMVKLGKIIAVDMFNGNEDRFNAKGGVVNLGNIIFQKNLDDKSYNPVGLDFYEAQGKHSSVYGTPDATWSGNTLKNPNSIVALARNIVRSLNALNPDGAQLNETSDLFNLNKGIAQGSDELKAYLVQKDRAAGTIGNAKLPRGLPAGVVRKMQHLGWI